MWEQVASQMRGKVDFKFIDGDDDASFDLKKRFRVGGYPTIIFADRKQKVLLVTGAMPADEFKATINQFVK